MESIEARAFKSSSFVSEVAVKPADQQAAHVDGEDCLLVSPVSAGEDFLFEEFFDLQGLSEGEGEDEEEKTSSSSSSLSLSPRDQVDDERSSFSGEVPVIGVSSCTTDADGLAIPADDIKELELWSHLMDDTICDDIFACPTRNVYVKTGPSAEKRVRFEPARKPATVEATRFPPPIPSKPRSKRFRINRGAWFNSWLLEPVYSSSPSLSLSEPGSATLETVQEPKSRKPGVKGLKRKPAALENGGSLAAPVQQRRCTHCQVQKTPQWRAGPLGPKTLCNACGVRFKSGRLFPEYRPACSPTFSSEVHSNSHRKVIEMRKKKTAEPSGLGFAPSILSC